MSGIVKQALAGAGSTGNNNHASGGVPHVPALVAVVFTVEAVGATPTISYKLQETFDDPATVNDASANWADVILLPSDNDTAAVTRVVTAVGQYISYLAQNQVRFMRRVRLATSANTNVTYRCDQVSQYRN